PLPRSGARSPVATYLSRSSERLRQAVEEGPAVVAPQKRVRRALGVRHQAENIALLVVDASDIVRRSVRVRALASRTVGVTVSKRDPTFAIEAPKRLGVGEVIAVMMGHRYADGLADPVASREQRMLRLDTQVHEATDVAKPRIPHERSG